MSPDFSDERLDINPKSWLSKYRKTSYIYLLKMGLFYSAVGMVVAYLIMGIEYLVFNYEEPFPQASLIQMIVAGPFEETLFFGIPFAISGNQFVVLITGSIWAFVHVFNAQLIQEDGFSLQTVGFAIPHIFFSLRTWKSGKGWFTILFHSGWNAMVFGIAVSMGEIPFSIIDENFPVIDIVMIIFSSILMGITYPIYRWRLKREIKKF